MLPSLGRLNLGDRDALVDDAQNEERGVAIRGRLFGVRGREPSVGGYGPLIYKDELDPAFERLRAYGSARGEAGFTAGVLADIDEKTFCAYVVRGTLPAEVEPYKPAEIEVLDVLFDRKTFEAKRVSPVVNMRDPVFTWAGVVGIAKLWWDTLLERPRFTR